MQDGESETHKTHLTIETVAKFAQFLTEIDEQEKDGTGLGSRISAIPCEGE